MLLPGLVCALSLWAFGQDVGQLENASRIEAEIKGRERHTFSLRLAAGQLLRVSLEGSRVRMGLELRNASGTLIASSDHHLAASEVLLHEAAADGSYQLAIRTSPVTLTGKYVLSCAISSAITEIDRKRLEASRISQKASEAVRRGGAPPADLVAEVERGLSLWKQIGDREERAHLLVSLASAYRFLGQHDKTITVAEEAGAVFRESDTPWGESHALRAAAIGYAMRGKSDEALPLFERALVLDQKADFPEDQARRYSDLGATYVTVGRHDDARVALERGAALSREIGSADLEVNILGTLSQLHLRQGRNTDAIQYGLQAVALCRKLRLRYFEGMVMLTLGQAYANDGQYKQAVDTLGGSLQIQRELKNRDGILQAHQYLAEIYVSLGRYDEAIHDLEQAQAIGKETDNQMNRWYELASLARVYMLTNQLDKSLETYQLAMSDSVRQNSNSGQAWVQTGMADVYSLLRQDDRAIDAAERALALYRKEGTHLQAGPLNTLTDLYARRGQRDKAREYLDELLATSHASGNKGMESAALLRLATVTAGAESLPSLARALALARELSDPLQEGDVLLALAPANAKAGRWNDARESAEQALDIFRKLKNAPQTAAALNAVATIEQQTGRLELALAAIEESLRISESQRARIFNPTARMSWFSSAQQANRRYISILMELDRKHPGKDFAQRAFEAAEHGRARSLLELLRESREDYAQDSSPELLREEKRIARQIEALESERMRWLVKKQPVAAAAMDEDIADLRVRFEQLQGEIRRASPRYAQLSQAPSDTLAQIREQLDTDTLLIEYALEEKRSFAWVVGRDRLKTFELAGEATVAEAAKRVYHQVAGRDPSANAAIRELSRLVIAPLTGELGSKRLVIVADGVLEYIPFSLLDRRNSDPYHPLVMEHEVVALPSASTIGALRKQTAGRPVAPKTIAIFGDPVFAASDERLSRKPDVAPSATRILEHTVESAPVAANRGIPRLVFTKDESRRIAALAPERLRLEANGFRATRALAMSPELRQYRYLHFATHGWLDSETPERSSLVLSLLDSQGKEQDGFLRSSDISGLKLAADLVTLSACQTGLGKQIAGEGMIGLTRSFLHAGAARVVVSYWNVNDEATADLMSAFYQRMLKQGQRPAAALRSAQLSMLREKRWSSPYFWAPFTMLGEWR